MKWYSWMLPRNWYIFNRKKQRSIEACSSVDEMMDLIESNIKCNSEIQNSTVYAPCDVFSFVGLLFTWIPLLCGLHPFWRYNHSDTNSIKLFFPSSFVESIAPIRRDVATWILVFFVILGNPLLFGVKMFVFPVLTFYALNFVVGLIGWATYGFRWHPKLRKTLKQSSDTVSIRQLAKTSIENMIFDFLIILERWLMR